MNELHCSKYSKLKNILVYRTSFKTLSLNYYYDKKFSFQEIQYKITSLKIENSELSNMKFFSKFPNLIRLILRKTLFFSTEKLFSYKKLKILNYLDLSSNKLDSLSLLKNFTTDKLTYLDISNTKITQVLTKDIFYLRNLKVFKILNCNLKKIQLNSLLNLIKLDLTKSQIKEEDLLFLYKNLKYLRSFYSQNFYICCIFSMHYSRNFTCEPSYSPIKSCSRMLKSSNWSIFFWFTGIFGFLRNVISLIIIVLYAKISKAYRFMLSFSDLLVSIYLLSICILNEYFGREYIKYDWKWRNSNFCLSHGILLNLSLNLSYVITIFMTIERYLSIRKPFKENFIKKYQYSLSIFLIFFAFGLSYIPAVFVLVRNILNFSMFSVSFYILFSLEFLFNDFNLYQHHNEKSKRI